MYLFIQRIIVYSILLLSFSSCDDLDDFYQKPELESLTQGIKTSALVGYSATVAMSIFKGDKLPSYVTLLSISRTERKGIYFIARVGFDKSHVFPFNNEINEVLIAGLGKSDGGVITVIPGSVDIYNAEVKFMGIETIPIFEENKCINSNDNSSTYIMGVFAKQDIITESFSTDAMLKISLSDAEFNMEMERLNSKVPTDNYAAIKQDVWFVCVNQRNTSEDIYDDVLTCNGGGQILEASSDASGIMYHSIINTVIDYNKCAKMPISGYALTQNEKLGGKYLVDLSTSLLKFNDKCNGKVHVEAATGKYWKYNNEDIRIEIK